MLQRIREGLQGPIMWVILGLIALTFVFWGGSGALDFSSFGANSAAEVNGEEITITEAQQAWSDTQQRWSQQFATEVPEAQRKAMQATILDNLIMRKVVEQRLEDANFRVSDAAVFAQWRSIPQFQTDGQFDPSKAAIALQEIGQTEHQFRDDTRQGMLYSQLQKGIGASYFLTSAERQRLLSLENEEREMQYLLISPDKYASTEPLDEAAIQAYYDQNGDRFMTNEYAVVHYAELRLEQLASQVAPTDADLRQVYDENRARYVREESRRARHIVIGIDSADDEAAALKEAEGVLAEARAGKDFAELARTHSTDVTAAQGGDLGFVTKEQFAGPIGDALFSMKVGDVSAPVKSQFGYHILKLEEIQAAEVQPFEEVRAELDSQYRQDMAAELFGERQDQIQAQLDNGVTDLDHLAKELGLTTGTVEKFLRGGGGEPLGSGPDLQETVFSDGTLNQGKIGGPIALGEDRLVLVKVTEHHKAEVRPLAEVRDQIEGLLRHERAVTASKAAAEDALKKLQDGAKIEDVAKDLGVTAEPQRFVSRGDPSIPAALRTAVFDSARPADKPVIKSTSLDDGSSALFVVTRIRVGDSASNPAMAQQQAEMLQQRAAQGDIAAYVNQARAEAKVTTNPNVFAE